MKTLAAEMMENPECMCCPIMDICTIESDEVIAITRDMIERSNCSGGFVDAFEDAGATP